MAMMSIQHETAVLAIAAPGRQLLLTSSSSSAKTPPSLTNISSNSSSNMRSPTVRMYWSLLVWFSCVSEEELSVRSSSRYSLFRVQKRPLWHKEGGRGGRGRKKTKERKRKDNKMFRWWEVERCIGWRKQTGVPIIRNNILRRSDVCKNYEPSKVEEVKSGDPHTEKKDKDQETVL